MGRIHFRDAVRARIHRRCWRGEPFLEACQNEGLSPRTAREWRRRGESGLKSDIEFALFWDEAARAERLCDWGRSLGIDVGRDRWNAVEDAQGGLVPFWEAYDGGELKEGLRIPSRDEVRRRARAEFGDDEDEEGDDEPWA